MRALIEFLSDEPLDNFITALSYDVDQIVYFGYEDKIAEQRADILKFAMSNSFGLGMEQKDIIFKELKHYDFTGIIKKIYDDTMDIDGDIFFDITGGDDLILVAFGRVAEKIDAPLYNYDFENSMLVELQRSAGRQSLMEHKRKEPIKLGFPGMECLYNWSIKTKPDEEFKAENDQEFLEDVEKIWALEKHYGKQWNLFLRDIKASGLNLYINSKYQEMIDDLVKAGIMTRAVHKDHYDCKNESIKDCLTIDGSVLEIITYQRLLQDGYEAKVGVPIEFNGSPVKNEIDGLAIKDNIPTFISCKAGIITHTQVFELDTLARKVCGKYAKKKVALALKPDFKIYKNAYVHGIETWWVDRDLSDYEKKLDEEDERYED